MGKSTKKSFTISEGILIGVILLLFLQIYLQDYLSKISYLDELVSVGIFLLSFLGSTKIHVTITHFKMIIGIAVLILIGLWSNFTAKIQVNLAPILIDIGSTIKIFLLYIGVCRWIGKIQNKKRIVKIIGAFMRGFVVILALFAALHQIMDIGMGRDMRYGMRSFQFINHGAGQLSFMFYEIITILTIDLHYNPERKKEKYIFLALIVWCTTLRTRAFLFVAIYIFLYWYMIKKEREIKLNIQNIMLIGIVALIFGLDQAKYYFTNTETARANLLYYGIYTMKRYFPIGSGFATYGTDAAVKYYSKLYTEYGFGQIYGLSRRYPMFAHDSYWPAIIAQFGVIGTIIVGFLLFIMIKNILRRSRWNPYCYLSGIFICITQLFASLATATFFHFITAALFFIVPFLFSDEIQEKNKKKMRI